MLSQIAVLSQIAADSTTADRNRTAALSKVAGRSTLAFRNCRWRRRVRISPRNLKRARHRAGRSALRNAVLK